MHFWHIKYITDIFGKLLLGKNGRARGYKQGIFLLWLRLSTCALLIKVKS